MSINEVLIVFKIVENKAMGPETDQIVLNLYKIETKKKKMIEKEINMNLFRPGIFRKCRLKYIAKVKLQ